MTLDLTLASGLNTLRKDSFLPYLLPRSFAGENERGEQAVIYHQPASASENSPIRRGLKEIYVNIAARPLRRTILPAGRNSRANCCSLF